MAFVIAQLLMLCVLIVTAGHVWTGIPRRIQLKHTFGADEGRKAASLLKKLAFLERVRAWQSPSLSSRQASWIAANAEFTLYGTKALDPKTEMTHELAERLVKRWLQLFRASTLSRLGAREIPEDRGAKLRAYLSKVDCSMQTYSVSVPAVYDEEIAWPLIVSMHGHGWFKPFQGHPAPAFKGAFGLSPQGRGATDYKELGENDVLQAIAEVCRDFNIDRNRIYLKGGSMGGTGTLSIGVHYADRFAGLVPSAANADYLAWSERWGWNAPFEGRFDDLRTAIQEAHTARAFAVNLLNVPVFMQHGSADTIVPPAHSRNMWQALTDAGCKAEYREHPNVGHGGFPGQAMNDALAWTCAYSRNEFPKHVTWRAASMRHGRAYWVRMDQKRSATEPAEVSASALNDRKVAIQTSNLEALSILRNDRMFSRGTPLFVDIDGERVIFPSHGPWPLWCSLRRDPLGRWRNASNLPSPPLHKKARIEGPIQDVFRDPFVLVVGTASSDPTVAQFWLLEARAIAEEWRRRNLSPCPFVYDHSVTETMIREKNLILLGDARDNYISARLQFGIPTCQDIFQHGSQFQQFDETKADTGWLTVYPNPENPERLVVVHGANGVQAIYQSWKRFGNWFNWGVFDSKKYFDYAIYDGKSCSPESLIVVGFYGTEWDLETGKYWNGVPQIRAELGQQGFPEFAVVPPMLDVFDLADLHPASIDQMRGAVAFERSYHGAPMPNCIGVRAPSAIEYELDGGISRMITGCKLLNSPENILVTSREKSERVRFLVKGDGKPLGDTTVSWQHPNGYLEIDLKGIKKVRLETQTAGGPAWLHAGAVWIAPRLYR